MKEPKIVKTPNPTGWDKDKFGDNRDLKEVKSGGSKKLSRS